MNRKTLTSDDLAKIARAFELSREEYFLSHPCPRKDGKMTIISVYMCCLSYTFTLSTVVFICDDKDYDNAVHIHESKLDILDSSIEEMEAMVDKAKAVYDEQVAKARDEKK